LEDAVIRPQLATLTLLASISAFSAVAAAADTPHGTNATLTLPRRDATLQLPVTGTVTGGGTFNGTFTLKRFAAREGRVVAIGIVRGTATSAAGVPLGTVFVAPVELPVTVGSTPRSASGTVGIQQVCDILNLDLGATNLDVLGLQVALLPIAIDLTAVGEGTDVLGRLICTVLETVGNVIGLVNLLNQILGLLGGLAG
jgi:hypothetical protein